MHESRHILLVEDNIHDEELTLLAFKKSNFGHHIDVARDGAEALDYMFARNSYSDRNIKDVPAVILLDINLPKLNGTEVLREIRTHPVTCYTPVVMLTSSNQQDDLINSYNMGANSFIRKPVKFPEFVDAVQKLGIYWLLLNESPGETGL